MGWRHLEGVFILTNIVSPVGGSTESSDAGRKLAPCAQRNGNRVRWQPGKIWSGQRVRQAHRLHRRM